MERPTTDRGKVCLTLPYPPSINHFYFMRVCGKPPRQLIQKGPGNDGKRFMAKVKEIFDEQHPGARPTTARLCVCIKVNPPDRRTRDIDNLLKPILDSLTFAGLWADDEQVDELWIGRGEIVKNGAVTVEVIRLTGEVDKQLTI